jgi:hypothetical protein
LQEHSLFRFSFVIFVCFVVMDSALPNRQREREGASLAEFALDPDLPPMQLDKLLCQG